MAPKRNGCKRLNTPPSTTAAGVFVFPTMNVNAKVQRFVAKLVKAGRSVRIVERRAGRGTCGDGIYVYSMPKKRKTKKR